MKSNLKFLLEFIPLMLFFITNKTHGIIVATSVLVISSVIAAGIFYWLEKKIPPLLIISTFFVSLFGGLTILSHDDFFIKIKPTLVNLILAITLFCGLLFKKGLLKYIMESAFSMDESAWQKFSFRWGLFFIFLAIVNELIWRNFSTDFWVSFKSFGMLPITMLFTISQIPFLKKYAQFHGK